MALKQPDPICVSIKVDGEHLHNNITLVSTVITSSIDNITFLLGVLLAFLTIVVVTVLAVVCLVSYLC